MKVAIIGAGFAGLSTAYYLAKMDVDVTVFEKDTKPGGLAIGFKEDDWEWTLEEHYHHWFTSDHDVLDLAKEIGQEVIFKRPLTSLMYKGEMYQLDSPVSLLKFPHLSVIDRIRAGVTLFYLKYITPWEALESITAKKFLKTSMGKRAWEVLWEPLFVGKFGKYAGQIPASWFWARIKKRSARLGYPVGGFQRFANRLEKNIIDSGGEFKYNEQIKRIKKLKSKSKFKVKTDKKECEFDKVVCTLPSPIFSKVVEGLPTDYSKKLERLNGIGAINLVLRLKKQFLADGSYWLSVNEKDFPFIAAVEHTNFQDKKHYGDEHLVYFGDYLPHNHKYFKGSNELVYREFLPYIKKINPKFSEKDVIGYDLFKGYFAQPIIPLNYSKMMPSMETPIKGLYLNNMQMVYPWDRGTNYAVENGRKVADLVLKS